ncbi:unnamed protein product [Sphagnum balticum]
MLPLLGEHRSKFNLLVTFASPHLGISEVPSCIVQTGILYMRSLGGVESIRELYYKEEKLVGLAANQMISEFKTVILVGSHEDNYIPAYSALASYGGKDQLTIEMSERLNANLPRVIKCCVKFDMEESMWDVMTKRRGHISFLEDDSFIKYFTVQFQQYFYALS